MGLAKKYRGNRHPLVVSEKKEVLGENATHQKKEGGEDLNC